MDATVKDTIEEILEEKFRDRALQIWQRFRGQPNVSLMALSNAIADELNQQSTQQRLYLALLRNSLRNSFRNKGNNPSKPALTPTPVSLPNAVPEPKQDTAADPDDEPSSPDRKISPAAAQFQELVHTYVVQLSRYIGDNAQQVVDYALLARVKQPHQRKEWSTWLKTGRPPRLTPTEEEARALLNLMWQHGCELAGQVPADRSLGEAVQLIERKATSLELSPRRYL
jgi:hypothetical protein